MRCLCSICNFSRINDFNLHNMDTYCKPQTFVWGKNKGLWREIGMVCGHLLSGITLNNNLYCYHYSRLRHDYDCKIDTYAPKLKPSASAPSIFVWMFACLNDTVNDILSQETYQGSRSCPSKVGHIWQTRLKVSSSVGHVKDVLHDGVQIASTSQLPFERKSYRSWKHP